MASLAGLVAGLDEPRAVWLMAPAGEATEGLVTELAGLLAAGDVLVDGGNSLYKDSVRRGAMLAERGVRFLDAGVSGGVWGLDNGFCVMGGGDREAFEAVEPAIATLAPEGGYLHVGPSGAGHYVMMIHNGFEYGMMQALAEGFDLLRAYDDDLDLPAIAELWRHGSVVRSGLLDLAGRALADDPALERLQPYVEDSGRGAVDGDRGGGAGGAGGGDHGLAVRPLRPRAARTRSRCGCWRRCGGSSAGTRCGRRERWSAALSRGGPLTPRPLPPGEREPEAEPDPHPSPLPQTGEGTRGRGGVSRHSGPS